jgi:formamidopyrimidine-DNA glycosylase
MPELPDLTVYLEHLDRLLGARFLHRLSALNPFVLRSVEPKPAAFEGKRFVGSSRIGKRVVLTFEDDLHAVMHLMVAGRLRWLLPGRKSPARITLATFAFEHGTLAFTEAGSKRRASLHLACGVEALGAFNPGGIEPLTMTPDAFQSRLTQANHTLKRALTDPHLFAGIGNSYSDEILHRAKLSPIALTQSLNSVEVVRLYEAIRTVLREWTERLRESSAGAFPEDVTAFRPEMAVHGKFGLPCPVCGAPVQRIVYADNETNYCARCQTGGRILADRALSRLLKSSWPRSIDELG